MKEYIIQDFSGGVWSESHKNFHGILYASYYTDEAKTWEYAAQLAKKFRKTLTVTPIVR